MTKGTFALIIGPAGVGKSTVLTDVLARLPEACHVISTTCRPPRDREVDGRDYHFLSCDDFRVHAERGAFFEHAAYAGHGYGTARETLERQLDTSPLVVKIVEMQGAALIKALMPEAVTIFILPGTFEDLERRLAARPNMTPDQLHRRLKAARREIADSAACDHRVTNVEGLLEQTVAAIEALLRPFLKTA